MNKKELTNVLIELYLFAYERGESPVPDFSLERPVMMEKVKPLVKKILAPAPTPRQKTMPLAKDGKAHGGSVTITNPSLLKQLEELKEREAL